MFKNFNIFINESNASFIESDTFEAALNDHLKNIVETTKINIFHVNETDIYEPEVYINLEDKDSINMQIGRFSSIKQSIEELFVIKSDYIDISVSSNKSLVVVFYIECDNIENSNFFKSLKGIDKYNL